MLRALEQVPDTPPATQPPPANPQPPRQSLPASAARFRVDAGAGIQLDTASERRVAVVSTVAWYPRRVGAALSLTISGNDSRNAPAATASLRDDALALTIRAPLPLGRRVFFEPYAGAALHWVRLHASLVENGALVEEQALNPALRVGAALLLMMTRHIDLSLWLQADGLLRRQRYLYGPEEVLLVPRLQGGIGLALGWRFL
jgi:hypothetical protein